MKKHSLRIAMIASPLMIVVGLLVSGSPARAESQEGGRAEPEEGVCSNRTLRGDYGFDVSAQFFLGTLRGVGMTHYNGKGGLTQVDHIVIDGVPPLTEWLHGVGTYTINSDCTGTATLTFTDGPFRPPVTLSLVVVRQGTEVHIVVDNLGRSSGTYGTSVAIRRN